MKSRLLYFLGMSSVIICVVLFFNYLFKQACEEWKRPENVPKQAVWKGGCDGGNWLELVYIKADTIRFRVYRDWNGVMILDANFVYQNCKNIQLTDKNWHEYISFFNNTLEIYSKFQLDNNYCRLVPVYPVYYEEQAE